MKLVQKGQLLIVRGTEGQGLTARGRIMISPKEQKIRFEHPNKFYSIQLEHIVGPLSGIVLHFAIAFARKTRQQPICLCQAYTYPHNKGKGKCKTPSEES